MHDIGEGDGGYLKVQAGKHWTSTRSMLLLILLRRLFADQIRLPVLLVSWWCNMSGRWTNHLPNRIRMC